MRILFFDDSCVLCNKTALWLLKNHISEDILFVSLSGKTAQKSLNLDKQTDSIVFLDEQAVFLKSEAVLELIKHFPGWKWLRILRILPLSWRDYIYDWVARNRYRWFGRLQSCELPAGEYRSRYIDD